MRLVKYKNGNYDVILDLDTGTKIRKNDLDFFEPEYPESLDYKCTASCDMACAFCHEDSKPDGKHGDIMNDKFIETLHPYTELAIGGGNPLEHPDLIPFLEKCKTLKLIPSMTVNQKHFMENQDVINYLVNNKLIYGLGVSLVKASDEFIEKITKFKNAVVHVINGVQPLSELRKLYDKNIKLLILGYKEFRRGKDFYSEKVVKGETELYNELEELSKHFNVVSFDNLALKQLNPKRILSKEDWDKYYMGGDGEFTMFVDSVKKQFSTNSTTPENKRHALLDDMKDMFKIIKEEIKKGETSNA